MATEEKNQTKIEELTVPVAGGTRAARGGAIGEGGRGGRAPGAPPGAARPWDDGRPLRGEHLGRAEGPPGRRLRARDLGDGQRRRGVLGGPPLRRGAQEDGPRAGL